MSISELVQREYPERPIVSAHALVLREDSILLIKRAHPPSQGRWSAPGGAIELGETVREAVQREVREECGIQIETSGVVNVVDNIVRDESGRIRFHYVVIYLLAHHANGEARAASDALEVRWVRRDELEALDMHPLARQAARRAFQIAHETDMAY